MIEKVRSTAIGSVLFMFVEELGWDARLIKAHLAGGKQRDTDDTSRYMLNARSGRFFKRIVNLPASPFD